MKRLYVSVMRRLRGLLAAVGILGLLDRAALRSRTALWLRSWLSIYDLDDMLAFDVPWWTFEAADRVESFLAAHPGARTLEWGSGASTLWLAKRGAVVSSVEHDADWAKHMRSLLPASVTLTLVEPTPAGPGAVLSHKPGFEGLDFAGYVAAVDEVPGEFDLVVIDGRAREACLDRVADRVTPGGLVVFDNVDRRRYREAIERHRGRFEVIWTRGLTPSLPYPTRTALLEVMSRGRKVKP